MPHSNLRTSLLATSHIGCSIAAGTAAPLPTETIEPISHSLCSLLVLALMPSVQSFIRAVHLLWTHGGGHLEPTEHLLVEFLFDPVEVDDPAAWPFAVPTWNGFGLDATRLRALRTTYLVHTMHARACLCERAARA